MLSLLSSISSVHTLFNSLFFTSFISVFLLMAGMIKDGVLTIGKVSAHVYSPEEKIKVPDVLFYENTQVSLSAHHYQCAALLSSSAH